MRNVTFEWTGLCSCGQRSVLYSDEADVDDPASCEALEVRMDQRGGFDAICRFCDRTCIYVEVWIGGKLIERLPPDEMEWRGGEEAGPLPGKPWGK